MPRRGRQRWEGTPLPFLSAWDRQAAVMLSVCWLEESNGISSITTAWFSPKSSPAASSRPGGQPGYPERRQQLTGMSRSCWLCVSSVASSLGASKGKRSSCTGKAATSDTGRSRTACWPVGHEGWGWQAGEGPGTLGWLCLEVGCSQDHSSV